VLVYSSLAPRAAFLACVGSVLLTWNGSIGMMPQEARNGASEWRPLFDGRSLAGWRGYNRPDAAGTRWRVEHGMLTVAQADGADTRGQLDLITVDIFDRFELAFEWRVAPGGNSGVKYFVLEDGRAAIGHEYQIIDDERHADAKISPTRQTASLYDVLAASERRLHPAGDWNRGRIVSDGRIVEHWLNDARVLRYELASPALGRAIAASKFKDLSRFGSLQRGHLLLQDHGDRVWFRELRLRVPD
jgi:3-keto-disaccharide hydrolase